MPEFEFDSVPTFSNSVWKLPGVDLPKARGDGQKAQFKRELKPRPIDASNPQMKSAFVALFNLDPDVISKDHLKQYREKHGNETMIPGSGLGHTNRKHVQDFVASMQKKMRSAQVALLW